MFSYHTLKRIYFVAVGLFTGIYTYLVWVDAVPLLAYLLMMGLSWWCVSLVYVTVVKNKEKSGMQTKLGNAGNISGKMVEILVMYSG